MAKINHPHSPNFVCIICNNKLKNDEDLRAHYLLSHGLFKQKCMNPNSVNTFTEEKFIMRDLGIFERRLGRCVTINGIQEKMLADTDNTKKVAGLLLRLEQLNVDVTRQIEIFGECQFPPREFHNTTLRDVWDSQEKKYIDPDMTYSNFKEKQTEAEDRDIPIEVKIDTN